MTEYSQDGGPAFPTDNAHQSSAATFHYEGMSLRDYFAGQALVGLLAGLPDIRIGPDERAESAYLYADAMLEHRKGES